MKRIGTLICVVTLIAWQVLAFSSPGSVNGTPRDAKMRSVANQSQVTKKKQRDSYQAAQALLDKKGLPFDMEALTAPDWREKLAQTLAQMPEMQAVRRQLGPLEGVVIADTLYLPEKVELAGDTVMLGKHLIFEGSNAEIRGNHNLYILPINTIRVIGTTLSNLNRLARLSKTALPSWTDIQGLLENRDSAKTGLTIDTSWHAAAPKAKARRGSQSGPFQIMDDRSGGPGGPGADGPAGTGGSGGAPGGLGHSGLCGEQPNGGPGGLAGDGRDGNPGGPGGPGGLGGTGGNIYLELPRGDTGTYIEISRGGPGGHGGAGGPGGNGGSGGVGGNGGDGADCECSQGGQGSGGPGGPGGWGGRGGTGGAGGPGGRGGDSGQIEVHYQCELLANVVTDSTAGTGGEPGYGGASGYGGLPGQGGLGGNKGGGECPICPNGAIRGSDGGSGHSLGDGQVGPAGQWGADGISYAPQFVGVSVNCDPGGCTDHWLCWDVYYCECYWLELSPASGDITPQYWDCYCWYWYTYCEYLGCW